MDVHQISVCWRDLKGLDKDTKLFLIRSLDFANELSFLLKAMFASRAINLDRSEWEDSVRLGQTLFCLELAAAKVAELWRNTIRTEKSSQFRKEYWSELDESAKAGFKSLQDYFKGSDEDAGELKIRVQVETKVNVEGGGQLRVQGEGEVEKEVKYRKTLLDKIRDKYAFHSDLKNIAKVLEDLERDEVEGGLPDDWECGVIVAPAYHNTFGAFAAKLVYESLLSDPEIASATSLETFDKLWELATSRTMDALKFSHGMAVAILKRLGPTQKTLGSVEAPVLEDLNLPFFTNLALPEET